MRTPPSVRQVGVGGEVALAAAAGAVSFVVVAVVLAAADSTVVAVLLAIAAGAAVLEIAHRWGAAYAIPVAVLGLVAYDWFVFPPTHPEAFPDRNNLLSLLAYLAIGTVAGELAAYGARRAESSEAARAVLAGEQAALRRIATVVARGASREAVFEAIGREIAALVGVEEMLMLRYEDDHHATVLATAQEHPLFPVGSRQQLGGENLATRVRETGGPARIDDFGKAGGAIGRKAREVGMRSAIGTPIVVEGRLWGVLIAGTHGDRPLPPDMGARVSEFTDLMGTAIANTESELRAELLANEQAALRRVATLVAKDAPPAEIFAKVAEEAAGLLDVDCTLWRDDGDERASVVAVHGARASAAFPIGTSITLEGDGVTQSVLREGRPRRVEDYPAEAAEAAEGAREVGVSSAVGHPVAVRDETWGAIVVAGFGGAEPCPPGTEDRLAKFADLVATAIANAEARNQVERLAEEQAALRRVATLVAEGTEPAELFAAVTTEVFHLFSPVEPSLVPSIIKFDPGPEFVLMGAAKPMYGLPVGARWEPKELYVSTKIHRTGRSARVEAADIDAMPGPDADLLRRQGYLHQVGSPILVEGRPWGALTMNSAKALPPDTGERLEKFTELVATAIANTAARTELERLAEEQAALRKLATLVAEGAEPEAVFDAVTAAMERVLDVQHVLLGRYEAGPEATVVAHRGPIATTVTPGSRVPVGDDRVMGMVRRTGRVAQVDDLQALPGFGAELVREHDVRAVVGAPIFVEGRLWGVITASWERADLMPPDSEERVARFAELLDTAIASADTRDQLAASRARLLTAADDARRRVVRDLHDGAQQRLVHSIITLKLAKRALDGNDGEAATLVDEALEQAQQGNAELRELAHGILPAALTRGGLRAGVDTVVARLDLPVEVDIAGGRFDPEIEASAYFIVAEALTNVVKHARAGRAEVTARVADGALHLEIRDDGVGGADPAGHGLVGLGDRASALGGQLRVESPPSGGTALTATLPLPAT